MNENQPIELWDVSRLLPYAQNAKKHSDESVDKLARSCKKFGFNPLQVEPDGTIITGHGRRLAAIKLGLSKVPVIVRADLTKAEADALRLADNKVVDTEYDQKMMFTELQRLGDLDIDLTDLGFSEHELNFADADLGDMDFSSFADDIGEAVEQQKNANKAAAQTADDTSAPIVDALGFKRVTIAQSRELRDLMHKAEAKTGKSGIDALLAIISASI